MPLFLIPLGVAMMAAGVFGKKKGTQETRLVKTPEILLPSTWDTTEITRGMEQYQQNSGLLSSYVDGILSRFVMNQDLKTMRVRAQFLEQFNKSAAIAREAYKWQRVLKGGRAEMEEDAADLKAKTELERAKKEFAGITVDPEISELQKQIERETLKLQLASLQKQREELNRPAPLPPTPQAKPSAKEQREKRKAELRDREKAVREVIRETEQDSALDSDVRQRKLNSLYDRLSQIHEEQADLL